MTRHLRSGRPRKNHFNVHPLCADLRKIRLAANTTLEQLARISGHDLGTIGRWERGEHEPAVFAFIDVLGALGYELTIRKRA